MPWDAERAADWFRSSLLPVEIRATLKALCLFEDPFVCAMVIIDGEMVVALTNVFTITSPLTLPVVGWEPAPNDVGAAC